jgi:hypothetical protein
MASGTFLPPGLSRSIVKIESGGTDNYVMTAVDGETIQGEIGLQFDGNDLTLADDVGIIFGDAGEKIEGDGTNLVVESSGTLDMNSGGILTLDSGAAINIEPASGSAILLDGTISVDAGVVTGVTALTSATIDATTDFTIGDTVITDGVITDSSGLQLNANIDLNNNTLSNVGGSGNDWSAANIVTSGSVVGTRKISVENTANNGSAFAILEMKTPSGGATRSMLKWIEGSGDGSAGNALYQITHRPDQAYFTLYSGEAGGNIWEIVDGTNDVMFTGGLGVSDTAAPTTGIAIGANPITMTGAIAATGARVSHIYTTSQTTTNAETVDSWSRSKENIFAYTERALDIIRDVDVIAFSHLTDRDPSGRIKLGVRAESINEPLALVNRDYGYDLGTGPALDTMGLAALNVKAIQELEAEVERLRELVEA